MDCSTQVTALHTSLQIGSTMIPLFLSKRGCSKRHGRDSRPASAVIFVLLMRNSAQHRQAGSRIMRSFER